MIISVGGRYSLIYLFYFNYYVGLLAFTKLLLALTLKVYYDNPMYVYIYFSLE